LDESYGLSKILITGGSGFIGSNMINYLSKKKHQIWNLDLKNNSILFNTSNLKQIKFVKGNINNKKNILKLFEKNNFDHVINFAANTHVDQSNYFPANFCKTNILGLLNLLEAFKNFRKKKSKFIHISTDEVFGSLGKKSASFTEESRIRPNNIYSTTKAASDLLAFNYAKLHHLNVIVTNCANNYGENQHPEKLIPLCIIKCILKEEIPIYGNGKNIREWIYVNDHCKAIYAILKNGIPYQRYLIGSGQEKTNIDVVKQICDYFNSISDNNFNYRDLITFVKDRPSHDLRYSINAKKFNKEILNLKYIKFDTALIDTIKHYLKFKSYYIRIYKNSNWFKKHYAK